MLPGLRLCLTLSSHFINKITAGSVYNAVYIWMYVLMMRRLDIWFIIIW